MTKAAGCECSGGLTLEGLEVMRQMLRVTLPALRQDVHTLRRLGAPLTHTAATVSLLIFNASTLRPVPGARSYRPGAGLWATRTQ